MMSLFIAGMRGQAIRRAVGWTMGLAVLATCTAAQTSTYERSFPQSKAAVEKTLKDLQSSIAGRLPVLDGFADTGDRPLDRFQRGYYQCTVQVVSTPGGGSRVRVSAKITAWYADPVASKSGYQVLASNGRIETDLLDQLQQVLANNSVPANHSVAETKSPTIPPVAKSKKADAPAPAISAPTPQDTVPGEPIASSKTPGSGASPFKIGTSPSEDVATQKAVTDRHIDELTNEAKNLEEILRNQSHPNNLVAVKKSDTPVFVSANEAAKVLFLASAEDEFEMLDMNASWVHVRISGLSRGWIRRSSVEMPDEPESVPDTQPAPAAAQSSPEPAEQNPFQVENEQIASFPGSWEPLRGKTVKIISVQEAKGKPDETGSQAKLAYAKSLFDREYVELSRASTTAAGVVVVFDSEDGGMMAATLPVLQQWKSGTLSDEAMWRRCYFDPPEMFRGSSTP